LITPTNDLIAKSCQTTDTQDCMGRSLKIRRINALDRLRLLKAAGPELSQNDAWLNVAALAVAVMEIDGIPRATPVSERQIEAAVLALGDSGLQAVAEALSTGEEAMSLFQGSPEGNVVGTPN
jgi:hypothetical protein